MISSPISAMYAGNGSIQSQAPGILASRGVSLSGVKLSDSQVETVAKDFESLFITQMMEHMFSDESLGTDLFGDKETSDIYKGLMLEEYGKRISDSGGIGIADYVKQELLRLQEV
ncbi:MAG: rod-binding protein [Rickettsiales bacterium]